MPELPEVETTVRGLIDSILGKKITSVMVRNPNLRWPVDTSKLARLQGQTLLGISRRSKYIIFDFSNDSWLAHLGMSGSMRLVKPSEPFKTHDHISVLFHQELELRYHDPRRFGSWTFGGSKPLEHKLLADLGPEPLTSAFNGKYLHDCSRSKKMHIKQFIMDAKIVVGVGNIYANEALFAAGILPYRQANDIDLAAYKNLSRSIKSTLKRSLKLGGTTLRDFSGSSGQPGYFKQSLCVYGREGEPCLVCGSMIEKKLIGQRSTFWCQKCQR